MDTLHPLAVHLPIALALLWPALDAIGLWAKSPATGRVAVGILGLAVVTSLFATATGQAAFDVAVERSVDPELLSTHTDDADLVPWLLLVVLALRWGGSAKFGNKARVAAIAAGLAFWPYIISVGSSGGALVYEHGVGVWKDGDVEDAAERR